MAGAGSLREATTAFLERGIRFLRAARAFRGGVFSYGKARPLIKGGASTRGRRLASGGGGRHGEEVGYSSVESVVGEQVGHNFTYWRAGRCDATANNGGPCYSCSSDSLVTDSIFEFLRSYDRTRCIVRLKCLSSYGGSGDTKVN